MEKRSGPPPCGPAGTGGYLGIFRVGTDSLAPRRHTAAECRLPLWRAAVCLLMGNESETLFAEGRKRAGEW